MFENNRKTVHSRSKLSTCCQVFVLAAVICAGFASPATAQIIGSGQSDRPAVLAALPPNPEPVPDPILHSGPINPPPSALAVVSNTESVVQLHFTCGGNADYHDIQRRKAGDSSYSSIARYTSCTGTIRDANVLPETEYCYRVDAINTTHHALSNLVCITTPAPSTAPSAPVMWLHIPDPYTVDVIFRDTSTSETRFQAYYRRVGDASWLYAGGVSRPYPHRGLGEELQLHVLFLQPNTQYEVYVRAGYVTATTHLYSSSPVTRGRTRPLSAATPATACIATPANCAHSFALPNRAPLNYYSNFPITAYNASVVRLVLVVHGSSRNASSAFMAMMNAASGSAGQVNLTGETLVIAPEFEAWDESWREGGDSAAGAGNGPITSFKAADELISAAANSVLFPNLGEVVVAGHSAGGQFTQRYAAVSRLNFDHPGLSFRFVVTNPSSYLYLDPMRPSDTGWPRIPTGCAGYDDYKYGLRNRYGYAAQVTDTQIKSQYKDRYVVYLLGDADTIDEGGLDTSCQANAQGDNRFERGSFYYVRMLELFNFNRHRRLVVPNVGHDAGGMYKSAQGRDALFF